MAVVVAPLTEEYLFRMLLQGWLAKLFVGSKSNLTTTGEITPTESAVLPNQPSPDKAPPSLNPFAAYQPANSPSLKPAGSIFGEPALADLEQAGLQRQPWPNWWRNWLPIAISSTVFGLMHHSHGPDWVPLIILAIGLGYIYQRTHSFWPSVIVHGLFNSISMVALWIQLFVAPDNLHKMQ